MKRASNAWLTFLFVLIYVLIGLFLIITPEPSTTILCGAIAGVLAFLGIVRIISYFRIDKFEAMLKKELCNGLFLVLAAFYVILKAGDTVKVFIPVALSIVLIYEAMTNFQQAIDLAREQIGTWIAEMVSFGVVMLLSLMCLFNFFKWGNVFLMRFIGISYVVAAVASFLSMIFMSAYKKKHQKNEIVEAKAE